MSFSPYNRYLEFDLVAHGADKHRFTRYASENYYYYDDVLSELDEGRQAYLLSRMGGRQSFVTCCEPAVFKRTAGKIVWIESGKILAVK